MKPFSSLLKYLVRNQSFFVSFREIVLTSLAAFVAIFILVTVVHYASFSAKLSLLVLASMGASTFLLFVVPHSPMSQPWPVVGGHFLSSIIGVACAKYIGNPAFATATAVSLSIFAMHWMQCLHPPSAATAMIAVLGGPEVHMMGWQFCYEVVVINAGTMVVLSIIINDFILNRRYPVNHTHHPHHEQFTKADHTPYPQLSEDDFKYALTQVNGVVDVGVEDLVDLYEFAVEHAQQKK
jgi:CBS-domain-containing membrane protein